MPMYLPKTPEPEIWDIGGEPLEESGFEIEEPETDFEFDQRSEEGGLLP